MTPAPKKIIWDNVDFGEVIVTKRLGEGSYGMVYEVNIENKPFVIKINSYEGSSKEIINEIEVYKELELKKSENDFARLYKCLENGDIKLMVMEKLDFSFADYLSYAKSKGTGKVPLFEFVLVGLKLIPKLKKIHEAGFVHADIKANNIMFKNNRIFLNDFGNCERFRFKNGYVQEQTTNFGTGKCINYCRSIFSHQGLFHMPRDDLISLIYFIIKYVDDHFWMGFPNEDPEIEEQAFNLKIIDFKKNFRSKFEELNDLLDYCHALGFQQIPDYFKVERILDNLLKKIWINNEKPGWLSYKLHVKELPQEIMMSKSDKWEQLMNNFQEQENLMKKKKIVNIKTHFNVACLPKSLQLSFMKKEILELEKIHQELKLLRLNFNRDYYIQKFLLGTPNFAAIMNSKIIPAFWILEYQENWFVILSYEENKAIYCSDFEQEINGVILKRTLCGFKGKIEGKFSHLYKILTWISFVTNFGMKKWLKEIEKV